MRFFSDKPVSSPALAQMTAILGPTTATALYSAVTREYTVHLRKHIDAAKKAKTQDNKDCKFWGDILDRVDADPSLNLMQVVQGSIR